MRRDELPVVILVIQEIELILERSEASRNEARSSGPIVVKSVRGNEH